MSGRYRVFCAYGPHYREPGCGWERYVETTKEAIRLAEEHSEGQTHTADWENVNWNTDSDNTVTNIK